jgi:tetratricopeptide (TPR) repeat protein
VSAIRLSEHADELRKLGLYQRASALYKDALGEFSDAYCIQSRLAVQLGKMGLRDEALVHYRRAFELMPDSFGRVESHCFGCESVFAGPRAQDIAEQVFTGLIQRGATKPQAPYMLGYLRMEQGRYEEALTLFRQAVAMDPQYLNAWKHLHDLGDKTYIEPGERDIARLKLYEFDPRQLHVRYRLDEVSDLASLWRALSREDTAAVLDQPVYPLAGSARERALALAKLPPDMRQQLEGYTGLQQKMAGQGGQPKPSLAEHRLFLAALQLMGERNGRDFDD